MKQSKQNALSQLLTVQNLTNDEQTTLPLEVLQHFPEHKFKLYEGDRLTDMVSSIVELGVLLPVIVWCKDDNYTILSGHNRVEAAKLAGLDEVPVIIKENLTMEEATLIVTETNLYQRSFADMCHSERAYSLAQHYEAMKHQGKRTDVLNEIEILLKDCQYMDNLTCADNQHRSRSRDKLADSYGLSRDKVFRYIKLSTLEKSLLDLIDSDYLGVTPAYPISFIKDSEIQDYLALQIQGGAKVNVKKAEQLRKSFEEKLLTKEVVQEILTEEPTKDTEKEKTLKISPKLLSTYFQNNETQEEIENILELALKLYFEQEGVCI